MSCVVPVYHSSLMYELENVRLSKSPRGIDMMTDRYEIYYISLDKTCFIYKRISMRDKAIREAMMVIDAEIFRTLSYQTPQFVNIHTVSAPYPGELATIDFENTNQFLDYFVQHDDLHIRYANAFDINVKIENILLL